MTSSSSPSQGDGSRTTSSDEWDQISRGSATESALSVSRESSMARSPRVGGEEGREEGSDQREGGSKEGGQQGLTARMLGMLGKPLSAVTSPSPNDEH